MTSSFLSLDMGTIYRPVIEGRPDFISQAEYVYFISHCQTCWGYKRIALMTSSWCLLHIGTNYGPDTKWDSELISQALHVLLTSNLVRYIGVLKELHEWCNHGSHVFWEQSTDQIQH